MIAVANQSWNKTVQNVSFKVAAAESIPVEENSTQLILVARAIHYFDHKTFFKEAGRILVNMKT